MENTFPNYWRKDSKKLFPNFLTIANVYIPGKIVRIIKFLWKNFCNRMGNGTFSFNLVSSTNIKLADSSETILASVF